MGQKAPDAGRTHAQGRSVREPLRRDDANKTHLRRWPTVHSRTRRRERKARRPSGGRIRERRPIVKPARPRAMRTTTRARVRVISSYETFCVVRSLVCVRTRTRDAPRRRRRVTIERSRRGASGGALAVGTPPPRARARFLVASFFFFSPFSPIAISRSRDLAKSRATVGVVEVEKVEKVDMGPAWASLRGDHGDEKTVGEGRRAQGESGGAARRARSHAQSHDSGCRTPRRGTARRGGSDEDGESSHRRARARRAGPPQT